MSKYLMSYSAIIALCAACSGSDVALGGARSQGQGVGQADENETTGLEEESAIEESSDDEPSEPTLQTDQSSDSEPTEPTEESDVAFGPVATYSGEDVACEVDSDCCVVFDECKADPYVVAASEAEAVRELLDAADMSLCVAAIPPAIEVRCQEQRCVGTVVPFDQRPDGALSQDHCGLVEPQEPEEPDER